MIRFLATLLLTFLLVSPSFAQTAKKKSYTLHGTVQAVKDADQKVTVKHDKIEGYMAAMTMDYKVGDAGMIKKLKPGDEITATLYEDDFTLYNIQTVAHK